MASEKTSRIVEVLTEMRITDNKAVLGEAMYEAWNAGDREEMDRLCRMWFDTFVSDDDEAEDRTG